MTYFDNRLQVARWEVSLEDSADKGVELYAETAAAVLSAGGQECRVIAA